MRSVGQMGYASIAAMAFVMATAPAIAQVGPPATAAEAAAPATDDTGNQLGDIVVVARKIGEAAQSLPIAITAFSGQELTNKAVIDVRDLQAVTPGLTISSNAQGGAPIFAIRGTATENLIDGGVAVYLNDVPVASKVGIVNAFYDISAVEILKGPQGTQFGTNTTGGTITLRTNPPTDKFEGYLQGGYGNYNRREVEGMINIPASDILKFRVAGNYVKRDGYVRDPIAASGIPNRFSNEDHYSVRGSALLDGGPVKSLLVLDYYKQKQLPIPPRPVGFGPNPLGVNPANFGDRTGDRDTVFIGPDLSGNTRDYFENAKLFGLEHRLNLELSGNLTLRNVVGYRHDFIDSSENNSGTTLTQINVLTRTRNDQWNDDVTLQFKSNNGRLRANIGGFFQTDRRAQGVVANAAQGTFLVLTKLPLVANIRNYAITNTDSKAIYANTDYDLTDKLTLSGGFRYNWDSQDLAFSSAQGIGLPYVGDDFRPDATTRCNPAALKSFVNRDLTNCIGRRSGRWRAPSYTAVVTDHFSSRALAYAKISHGYLAGGLNTTVREVPVFDPETTTMFEGGVKADWSIADRPIRTNVSIYYGRTKNKQVVQNTNYDDGGSANGVFNAAKETVYGADLDIRYSPIRHLTLDASYNYIHAKFDSFSFPAIGGNGDGKTGVTLNPPADLSGNTPAQTPKHQVNLAASYDLPLDPSIGTVTTTISGYYTSRIAASNVLSPYNAMFGQQFNTINGYVIANASLNWTSILGTRFGAQLWVRNLFDRTYATFKNVQFQASGYSTAIFSPPRTYGGSLTVKF